MAATSRLAFQWISQQVWLANCPTPSNALCCFSCLRSFGLMRSSRSRAASWGGTRYTSLPWILPRTVYCMLVLYWSELLFSWACFGSEISSVFVIADVRPKIAISSFFQILRVDWRIWETTRVFSLPFRVGGGSFPPPWVKGWSAAPCWVGRGSSSFSRFRMSPPRPPSGRRHPPPRWGGSLDLPGSRPRCGYYHLPLLLAPPWHQGRR